MPDETNPKSKSVEPPAGIRFGLLDGRIQRIPDFLEPMSPEELELWQGRGPDED